MNTFRKASRGAGIDFSQERWEAVRESSRCWWSGRLGRPLIQLVQHGRDPGREEPELPWMNFTGHYDLSVPAEAIVDRWDYGLSCRRFLGDAFPGAWPNFGPGVSAAFLGAKLESDSNTIWFHPQNRQDVPDLSLAAGYDLENCWLRRVKDLCRTAVERWKGLVQVGMTDLGGNLDIVSVFRPGEELLMDLYDHPEEVKRLTWEAHAMWWRFFDEINQELAALNPGYTGWLPVYSETPYYVLQCDFCYMIGPDMFDEFVKPELAASCKRLSNSIYHLDGVGQLPHLDSLLSIPELTGVQWVPGDGQPAVEHWPEVYRKIRAAGKLIQVSSEQSPLGYTVLDVLADQLGSAEGIALTGDIPEEEEEGARRFLRKYGVA